MTDLERRRVPRFACRLRAVAIRKMLFREVTLLDVSMNGAFVDGMDLRGLFVGATYTLRILDSNDRELLEVVSTVAHCMDGKHVGLAFKKISPEAGRTLYQLINRNLETEAIHAREQCISL